MFVYFCRSHRTRLVLVSNDDVLLVRGYYGSGKWSLPGGGLHRNESPEDGLVREVREETGIIIDPKRLKELFEKRVVTETGLRFTMHAYGIKIKQKPKIRMQRGEIHETTWMNYRQVMTHDQVSDNTKRAVAAFYH